MINPAGKLRPSPGPSVRVGQMQKALVHSWPFSASILLPAASTSTDAAEAQETVARLRHPGPPCHQEAYSRVASTSTLGICNPRAPVGGPRLQITGTSRGPDRRDTGFELERNW